MTFLQPFVLWGLPLVLLPVLIHLLNRMRHRPRPWAAMRFLVSANRTSVSRAKLRQFLILLCRVLAVLMLIFFLGRPLAGGWIGWVLAPAPDTIVILLDRSASMETQIPNTVTTRREQALKSLAAAAAAFEDKSHLVLVESALREPQEIARASDLAQLPVCAATDAAADLPAMLQTALQWLIDNRAGTTELWITSDLQQSNWKPGDARWSQLSAQLGALPQKVRIRLLAFDQESPANASVQVSELVRQDRAERSLLQFVLDLERSQSGSAPVPLSVRTDEAQSQIEVPMEGQSLRWRHQVELRSKSGGWGSFALPADANLRDNTAFFAYGDETFLRAAVVAQDAGSGRPMRFAAGAFAKGTFQPADLLAQTDLAKIPWDDLTLVVWQGPLPEGPAADQLRAFVEQGGVAVFFPPGQALPQRFLGMSWGEAQTAQTAAGFRVLRQDNLEGPLANTEEGQSLPLMQVAFQRRQLIEGNKSALAAFEDGAAFLIRQRLGRGEVLFCGSLPRPEWSSLDEGYVLVPMLQRLLQAGSRRLQQTAIVECGELNASELGQGWTCLDATTAKDIRTQAGVFRSGERVLAVNRASAEDDPDRVEAVEVRKLFGPLPLHLTLERAREAEGLQGEIWRLFLLGMLAFLLVEGALILPQRGGAPATVQVQERLRTPVVAEPVNTP